MNIGDTVQTHHGEQGILIKKCPESMNYDWWVEIRCSIQGEGEHTVREPYRNKELKKLRKKVDF